MSVCVIFKYDFLYMKTWHHP